MMINIEKVAVTNEFSNLDVLFIVPPVLRILGKKWDYYPLGLGYLVSNLDQINVKSAIYHANYSEIDKCPPNENYILYMSKQWENYYSTTKDIDNIIWHELTQVLKIANPKIVGISSTIVGLSSTYIIANTIKNFNKEITVIVGGPLATTGSEKLINNSFIDFLVIGEGEQTINELIPLLLNKSANVEKLSDIKGIMYKKDNNIIKTGKRELISNLDKISFPNREKVFFIDKNKQIKKIYLTRDILLSRGCPYNCRFCSAFTIWGSRKPRSRTNDNIIEEIIHLKTQYNQKQFIFWDDLFTINRNKVVDLCNKIIQKKLNIKWICLARMDTIDKELILLMKKAGCVELQFGVESGSDRILDYIGKGLTINQIIEKAKIIRESNIRWLIFLIIGVPNETEQEIYKTIKFIEILKPYGVNLSMFSPYPGTELYTELLQLGQNKDKLNKSDFSNFENNWTLNISDERFKQIIEFAFNYVNTYNKKERTSFRSIINIIQQKLNL